jgi:hypothetical protein
MSWMERHRWPQLQFQMLLEPTELSRSHRRRARTRYNWPYSRNSEGGANNVRPVQHTAVPEQGARVWCTSTALLHRSRVSPYTSQKTPPRRDREGTDTHWFLWTTSRHTPPLTKNSHVGYHDNQPLPYGVPWESSIFSFFRKAWSTCC